MTDIQRAMLGDHDAAARLTEQWELIPCPFCGGNAEVFCENRTYGCACEDDGCTGSDRTAVYHTKYSAILDWNTRAPLLTPEQMERLECDSE